MGIALLLYSGTLVVLVRTTSKSLAADICIMRSLRKTFESSSSNSEEGKLNIPIKATVLSAMTIMSHMAITIW